MALTQDIVATYKGPRHVVGRFLRQGRNEVRSLIFLLLAGVLIFVASAPYQSRLATLDPEGPLEVRLYWSGFLWIFLMPLVMYIFALLVWGMTRIAGRRLSGAAVRLTLFWALLASTPVLLLLGLAAGMIGPGIQTQLVGFVWLAVFAWFWFAGLLEAEKVGA